MTHSSAILLLLTAAASLQAQMLPRPAGDTQPTSLGFEASSARVSIIDYVLHNAGFTADAFQVITDHDGLYFPSDHLPVVARVAFAPGP